MKNSRVASPRTDRGRMRRPVLAAGGATSGLSASTSDCLALVRRVRSPIGKDRTQRYDQLMLALIVVLFIAELYVMVLVAGEIGVLNSVALLVAVAVLGVWLVKRQGLAVLRRLRSTVDAGQVPHREVV